MKHILIFGASIVHGVGGEHGGWADKIKASLYKEMYGAEGERLYEVYELGIPGTALPDIQNRFEAELKPRIKGAPPKNVYVIFSAGVNDSIAIGHPEQYVRTPDDFAASIHSFIHLAKEYSAHILGVGVTPVDESKTNPRNGETYYSNTRLKVFEEAFQRTCDAEGLPFVPLFDHVPPDWIQAYAFRDGLHPNDAGHEWLRSQVEPKLRELLGQTAA
jgi:lysophospholipase L1-like esterase